MLAHIKLTMKQRALLILFILPIQIFSQTIGIVVDKKTRKPIEYVNIWVENQDIGTTSDIEGKFTIKENVIQKTLIISAIGYENQRFVIDNSNLKIQLNPKTYSIKELVVKPKKIKKQS